MKVSEEELIKIANIYNTSGKDETTRILKEEYQIRYPWNVIKRLKDRNLISEGTRKEGTNVNINPDEVFLSMNELCIPTKTKSTEILTINQSDSKAVAMDKLMHELIGDRLLELSRYIILNPSDRTIIIDKTTLVNDGYQMIMH